MWGSYVVLGHRDHREPSPGLSPNKYTLGRDVPESQDQDEKDPEQPNTQRAESGARSLEVVVLTVGRLGRLPAGLHEGQWAGTGCVGSGLPAAESHLLGCREGRSKSSRKRLS